MRSRLLTVFALVAGLGCLGQAQQVTPDQQKDSDRILAKFRKLEVYNQILPVLFTPDQARAFLPLIESHRSDADKIEIDEHKYMLTLETGLDAALKDAVEKGKVPDNKVMQGLMIVFKAFVIKRKALIDDTVFKLAAKMREKLDAGQIRAAAHAFNPVVFGIELKDEELTEEKRLDLWIRMVLMDNSTYPVMVEVSRRKS